jgi:hypothetical protein
MTSTIRRSPVADKLIPIYSEMRDRQRSSIEESKTMRCDPFFTDSQSRRDDTRRCLAISAVLDDSIQSSWSPAYERLQKRLGGGALAANGLQFAQSINDTSSNTNNTTPWGQLHWTAMQLVGFADFDQECSENNPYQSKEYLDCIQEALVAGGMDRPVTITFVGVIAVATGLLMIGIPSYDLNAARDVLREELQKRDLPLKEPFVNDIVHSTLYRVVGTNEGPLPDDFHSELLEIAAEYENTYLGQITLDTFQIGPASWRMLQHERSSTPPWRKWTLTEKRNRKEIESDNLRAASIAQNRYTISGASGSNLAKEIRLFLDQQQQQQLPSTISDDDEESSSEAEGSASSGEEESSQDSTTTPTARAPSLLHDVKPMIPSVNSTTELLSLFGQV